MDIPLLDDCGLSAFAFLTVWSLLPLPVVRRDGRPGFLPPFSPMVWQYCLISFSIDRACALLFLRCASIKSMGKSISIPCSYDRCVVVTHAIACTRHLLPYAPLSAPASGSGKYFRPFLGGSPSGPPASSLSSAPSRRASLRLVLCALCFIICVRSPAISYKVCPAVFTGIRQNFLNHTLRCTSNFSCYFYDSLEYCVKASR